MLLALLCAFPSAAHDDDPLYALQIAWWQWAGSIPLESNPLVEDSGQFCGVAQRGNYWYLAGNFGGETTRSCIAYVNDGIGGYRSRNLSLKVDGRPQPLRDICEITVARGDDLSGVPRLCRINYRADRNLFSFMIAPDTIYGSDPGAWRANAARGVWGVIDTDRLAPGDHVVRLQVVGTPDNIVPFMAVTYHLTIAEPAN